MKEIDKNAPLRDKKTEQNPDENSTQTNASAATCKANELPDDRAFPEVVIADSLQVEELTAKLIEKNIIAYTELAK